VYIRVNSWVNKERRFFKNEQKGFLTMILVAVMLVVTSSGSA
jgi:hypothetical protein